MLDVLLANLAQSAFISQHCLEQNYSADYYMQDVRDHIVRAFLPSATTGTPNYTMLDVAPTERSTHCNELLLQRWRDPAMGYCVSTSASETLRRGADRTKVLFRPSPAPPLPFVAPHDDVNRFHLIDAIYALDHFYLEDRMDDFLRSAHACLLPGGHLLCSLRLKQQDAADTLVKLAVCYGLHAVINYPTAMYGWFRIMDTGSAVKHLNTTTAMSPEHIVVSQMYHFIVFTRQ